MHGKRSLILLLLAVLALAPALAEESWLNRPDSKIRFQGGLELGFLSVLYPVSYTHLTLPTIYSV